MAIEHTPETSGARRAEMAALLTQAAGASGAELTRIKKRISELSRLQKEALAHMREHAKRIKTRK
jgi:cation transport regulator ChaC